MIAVEEPLMTQASIGKVYVDISVMLGWATMQIHQLLRMGRGVVIELKYHTGRSPLHLCK